MVADNASGRETSPRHTGGTTAGADSGHSFQAPARRRKPVYLAATVVFVIVAILIYFMAKPDTDRLVLSHVDAANAAVSEGTLSVEALRVAVASLNSAFELASRHPDALEAMRSLQNRVVREIDDGIARGELSGAEELLAAAQTAWPDTAEFDPAGDLDHRLDQARKAQALQAEIRDLLAQAKRRLGDEGDRSIESLSQALEQLRAALDVDQVAARELGANVRGEVLETTRGVLATDGPQQAQRLLDALGNEWDDDAEVGQLRDEVRDQIAALDRSRQLQELLDKADESLRADRLTTPRGNNAAEHYGQALTLDPDNDRAVRGLESVAERYTAMIGEAIENDSVERARRYLASLAQLAPDHPRLGEFSRRIDEAVAAQAATTQAASQDGKAETEQPDQAVPAEPVPEDPEGRLWYSIKGGCDQKELRRYIDTYPEGRYVDEAWKRISECLAVR